MSLHGKDAHILLEQYNLRSYLTSVSPEYEIEMHEDTTFGNDSKTYKPGQDDGMVTIEGFTDPAANAIDDILHTNRRVEDQVLTVLLSNVENDFGVLVNTVQGQITNSNPVGDLVGIVGVFQADGGVEMGSGLVVPAAKTVTGNSTALNNGAATSNGGVGHLHVTANSGTTPTLDVTIEDSADGSSGWATILTFTQVTTTNAAQRVAITGTVRQYIRAVYTIGGTSPSYTLGVAFARR